MCRKYGFWDHLARIAAGRIHNQPVMIEKVWTGDSEPITIQKHKQSGCQWLSMFGRASSHTISGQHHGSPKTQYD